MKSETRRKILSAAMAVMASMAVWAHMEASSHEIVLLIAAVGLYRLFHASFECDGRRGAVTSAITGLLFAVFMVLGKLNALSETKGYTLWLLIRFLGFWALFYAVLRVLFSKLSGVRLFEDDISDRTPDKCRRVFFLSLLAFCAWFFLWWLYEYPGNTFPDTNNQLMQALGLRKLSSDHPALSTLCLGGVFKLGLRLFSDDQNAAFALCMAVQSVIMASVFAYVTESLYEFGAKKRTVFIAACIYIIIPVYASNSVAGLKDVLFSGFITLFCTTLWRMLRKSDIGAKICSTEIVLLYISALLAGLFRNKSYYAFLILTPILPFAFKRGSIWIKIAAPVVFCAALLIDGPVYASFDIQHSDLIETYSVPAQHIARVIYDGHELSDAEYKLLSKAVDIERVPTTYMPTVSDPIKALIRETGDGTYIEEHSSEYLRLWLKLGMRYPGAYLRAQIDQTLGYWYPDVSYWTMGNYCEPSDTLTIYKDRKAPAFIISAFDEIGFYMTKLPLIGLAFSIGTAVWIMLSAFALCIVRKQYRTMAVFVPPLLLWLTLLAVTPVFAEFRYIFPMYTVLPLLCVIPLCGGENNTAVQNKSNAAS